MKIKANHPAAVKGYTLIELLTSVSVSAVLLGIALPAFNNILKDFRSTAIANEMIGHVIFARSMSVSTGKIVTVCGSSDHRNCDNAWSESVLVFSDENANIIIDGDDQLLRVIDSLKEGESLRWRSFRNKSYLQFMPTGMTYYQNGNFTYCPKDGDSHYARHWIINVAGHIRMGRDSDEDGIVERWDRKNIEC